MIKGRDAQYISWQTQDLERLWSTSSVDEGANRWIKFFEEQTIGKFLAMGDIKVLLALVIDQAAMDNVLVAAGIPQAQSNKMEGTGFSPYRRLP